jgi:hypothetical protein
LRASWKKILFLRPRRPWLRGFLIWNICTVKPSTGLARVSEVARQMDIVKPAPFVFTVAGTNGKGTTCRTLETVLMAAGYKVGSTALRIWCATPNACAFRERNCRRRRIRPRLLKLKRRAVTSR